MKKKLGKATGKKLPSRKKQEPNTPAPKFTEIKDPGMITQILALFGTAGGRPFDVPKGTKWVDIYARPIPSNWGQTRLLRLLKEEHGVDPELRQAFLFFNKAQDRLKLYYRQADGDQLIEKTVARGGFILPAGDPDSAFIKVSSTKLAALFRA